MSSSQPDPPDLSEAPWLPYASKKIINRADVSIWQHSVAYHTILRFIRAASLSVAGLRMTSPVPVSHAADQLVSLLCRVDEFIDEIPPLDIKSQRYGNKAFRTWSCRVFDVAVPSLESILRSSAGFASFVASARGAPKTPAPAGGSADADEVAALLAVSAAVVAGSSERSDAGDPVPSADAKPEVGEGCDSLDPYVVACTLSAYLCDSFGNATRIDYGTGHELAFVTLLCSLLLLGVFTPDDLPALILKVFGRYIVLMRRLQEKYALEPAGSHGVWGLDDYHHLSFLFGAAMLADSPPRAETPADPLAELRVPLTTVTSDRVPVTALLNQSDVAALAPENMFFSSIKWIVDNKKGPFHEHSPMLYDMSAVPSWNTMRIGLTKMYAGEVLGAWPVVQHFYFTKWMPLDPIASHLAVPAAELQSKKNLKQAMEPLLHGVPPRLGAAPAALARGHMNQPPTSGAALGGGVNAVRPGSIPPPTIGGATMRPPPKPLDEWATGRPTNVRVKVLPSLLKPAEKTAPAPAPPPAESLT